MARSTSIHTDTNGDIEKKLKRLERAGVKVETRLMLSSWGIPGETDQRGLLTAALPYLKDELKVRGDWARRSKGEMDGKVFGSFVFQHTTKDFLLGLTEDELVILKSPEGPTAVWETWRAILQGMENLEEEALEKEAKDSSTESLIGWKKLFQQAWSFQFTLGLRVTLANKDDNRWAVWRLLTGKIDNSEVYDSEVYDIQEAGASRLILTPPGDQGIDLFGLSAEKSFRTDLTVAFGHRSEKQAGGLEKPIQWAIFWETEAPGNDGNRLLNTSLGISPGPDIEKNSKGDEESFQDAPKKMPLVRQAVEEISIEKWLGSVVPAWLSKLLPEK